MVELKVQYINIHESLHITTDGNYSQLFLSLRYFVQELIGKTLNSSNRAIFFVILSIEYLNTTDRYPTDHC